MQPADPVERLVSGHYFPPSSSVRIYRNATAETIGVHCHEFYEMALVLGGGGVHSLNGTDYALKPGVFFLLTPADFHGLRPEAGAPIAHYNLIFTERTVEQDLFLRLFAEMRDHHYDLEGRVLAVVESCFHAIWEESQAGLYGSEAVQQMMLQRILVELVRHVLPNGGKPQSPQPARQSALALQKANLYVQHHFREDIRLQDAAREAQMAPNYFSERFGKAYGVSFQTYLSDLRLSFARSLLRSSELSVTEICFASGFNTLSHFERSFKRKFGTTPRGLKEREAAGHFNG